MHKYMKKLYNLNIFKIKKEFNIRIDEKIQEHNDSNLNYFQTRKLMLEIDESTTILLVKHSNLTMVENSITEDNIYLSNYNYNYSNSILNINQSLTESTFCHTKINEDNSIIQDMHELKFNSLRADFCLKYNLYDIPLALEICNYNHPPKYKITDELFAFLYPNEPITYCITITGFIMNNKILNLVSKNLEAKDGQANFNFILGLYFCGKKEQIKIGNQIESKICKPNEFICKQCMDLNKQKYNLKKKYLININGRISKINKGSYHCFGNFLIGNQIEQCITKFSCNACKNLNINSEYYF